MCKVQSDPMNNHMTYSEVITAPRLPLKQMDPSLLMLELLEYYPDDQQSIRQAVHLAARAHRGQTRATRQELPKDLYITHPLRVAVRLNRMGLRSVAITCAAVCHDVIEDCEKNLKADFPNYTPEEVVAGVIGEQACELVKALSIDPGDNRPYIEKISDLLQMVEPFWIVKTSDLMDNAGSLKFFPEGPNRLRKATKYNKALRLVLSTKQPQMVCYNCWSKKMNAALKVTDDILELGM